MFCLRCLNRLIIGRVVVVRLRIMRLHKYIDHIFLKYRMNTTNKISLF